MPFVSSPVAYPRTSPVQGASPSKRRRINSPDRQPLRDAPGNIQKHAVAGFLLDDSDDDSDDVAKLKAQGFGSKLPAVDDSKTEKSGQADIAAPLYSPVSPSEHPTILAKDLRGSHAQYGQSTPVTATHNRPTERERSNKNCSTGIWIRTSSGRVAQLGRATKPENVSYERIVAARSEKLEGRGQKSYYGIDVHQLMEDASRNLKDTQSTTAESETLDEIGLENKTAARGPNEPTATPRMWTEKYRARKFTDLVGDERTHRSVLKWLKGWDSIVFPNAARPKARPALVQGDFASEQLHRKVLLLTGPPGLGKTTLAHVCAKQAGFEVQEINASDERSRDVVRGRIRDMVGTENVKQVGATMTGKTRKSARPVCVIVDEVDGVVSGASAAGGEGGFVKALVDLLLLDQKNTALVGPRTFNSDGRRRRKGENFRMLRPLILICNDVYHASLRPLRQGALAEIVFVRKPSLGMVVPRVQQIFEREGLSCDSDGIRQLCEAAWGINNSKEDRSAAGTCEGDIRGILVIGEWVASRLRAEAVANTAAMRLTKKWVEQNILGDLAHGGGSARSLGRGGAKELVDRIFAHNAGFSAKARMPADRGQRSVDVTENATRRAVFDRLRELISSNGEEDRALTDCFSLYPSLPYQDDNFLTKPACAYDWLHFYDQVSSLVYSSQQWELAPHLPTSLLAFHDLFASNSRYSHANGGTHSTVASEEAKNDSETNTFSGPRASYLASETTKSNRAALQQLQSQLSLPLNRVFRCPEDLSVELLPYVLRMLSPEVKPVVVGGSEQGIASVRRAVEKEMIRRSVDAMIACGVKFERGRVDHGDQARGGMSGGWVYRMEPGLDALGVFETAQGEFEKTKTRFATRQVLEQEWKKEVAKREREASSRRMKGGPKDEDEDLPVVKAEAKISGIKTQSNRSGLASSKDFFGRPVTCTEAGMQPKAFSEADGTSLSDNQSQEMDGSGRTWVTYHEGYSTAVRRGITLKELLEGF